MALVLEDQEQYRALKRYIVDPEASPYPPAFELLISKVNVAIAIETFTLETGDNGAMMLDATLDGRLPYGVANSPIQARAYIGGIPIPIFAGRLGKPKISTTYSQIIGRSGSTYLEASKLGSGLAAGVPHLFYKGPASKLIRDAVEKSGVFPRSAIKVEKLDRKIDRASLDSGYSPSQSVRDLLTDVAGEAKAVFRDVPLGPLGTFEAFRDPKLGNPKDAVIEVEATEESEFAHETNDDEMYFDVVIDKPAQPDADPPVSGFRVRRPVPYEDFAHLPPYSLTDWIEISDDDSVDSRAEARRMANQVARSHAVQTETVSLTTAYNPILQKYDVIRIGENVRVKGGRVRFEWIVVIDSLASDSTTMTTAISGIGRIRNRAFIEDPPEPVRIGSGSVVQTPPGGLIPADELYPSDDLFPQPTPYPMHPDEDLYPSDFVYPS